MSDFYDGAKLLSLKDINGQPPEIYLCTSNRSAGKTTYFSRLLVRRFLNNGEKFCLVYRYKYELDEIADKFFKDIGALFFAGHEMSAKRRASGVYQEMFIDDLPCGYAIALNSADQLKKYSHLLSDTARMLFDEFQSETNHYCPDEIHKLISIHTSIARGQGKQTRYLPVYMCSNAVSLLNPYYVELGISDRLKSDTKFLRGNGFVLEQGFNQSASCAQISSAFNRAFSNSHYIAYAAQNIYLNDNKAFVECVKGKSKYLATLHYSGVDYAIREYTDRGILYCDTRADSTFINRLVVTTQDHNINYVMLRRNDMFLSSLRYFFDRGCFRFKNLRCKEAILKALSY